MVSGILRNHIYAYVFLRVRYSLSFMSGAALKKYVRAQESRRTKDSETLEAEGMLQHSLKDKQNKTTKTLRHDL